MSESVSIARLDDSRSTDSVVVVSADKDLQLLLQLFAITVICNYNYNYLKLYLIPLIYCVVSFHFVCGQNFKRPNTCYLSLIDLFDQCETAVLSKEHNFK